ncbi:selenocysteine-specific translation elongation factor [Actinophytocola oryzae]|uniref:Selenocysteine-specific elongation factor n=1 Tax=Actinophytocola oryzae TaxID=502181 RepID=A0A4R7W1A2_9PSEU|nr:selenocysteine-specific translation elongation factor [Actinophytocola oryzae]TDV56330.1 selenocysteine-specific translation elongation factor SelB [Actinophytocola oryzae]
MHVLATAGHVDHGKSTLVRALTGTEPDRFAEERRRGMTLDLGFAWTTLPGGETVAFVDVPGHERFISTMLAGVGPVPGVVVVVAADEGWRAQTSEHVEMLDSLGVRHGLLVVTRADLADPAPALAHARDRLSRTSLGQVEAVAVSAVTGAGLDDVRAALSRLVGALPPPVTDGRVRLFVDRAFTVRGSGTVVTGTLGAGTVRVNDRLLLAPAGTEVRVRGCESMGERHDEVAAVARVAVNLRGLPVEEVRRGHVLITPDSWVSTQVADVRLASLDPADLPGDLLWHIGSAAVPCRVRPLGEDTARVRLATPLPLEPGDRAVLREPSSRLATGVVVLDVDPPSLRRRGAALDRAIELEDATGAPDVLAEVARRGCVTRTRLAALGVLPVSEPAPASLVEVGEYLIDPTTWQQWGKDLAEAVDAHRSTAPLEPGLPTKSAARVIGTTDLRLVEALVRGASLVSRGGRIARPGTSPGFSNAARRALDEVCRRLDADPFDAPSIPELSEAGLTREILAAAAAAGMVLRLPTEVLLHPTAPAAARDVLAGLPQPFTLSDARQALNTTRRVAVPFFEYLDAQGVTVRVDSSLRRVNPVH